MEGKGIVKVEDITNRIYTLRGVHANWSLFSKQ